MNDWKKLVEFSKGETIELQGFLSRKETGEWLLTPARSCCQPSDKQVILPDNFSYDKPNILLKVKGVLGEMEHQQSVEIYRLAEVSLLQQEQRKFPVITFAIIILSLSIFLFLKTRLNRNKKHIKSS